MVNIEDVIMMTESFAINQTEQKTKYDKTIMDIGFNEYLMEMNLSRKQKRVMFFAYNSLKKHYKVRKWRHLKASFI